jgi:hypothetical protein
MTDEMIVETLEDWSDWWPAAQRGVDAINAGAPPQWVWRGFCAAFR